MLSSFLLARRAGTSIRLYYLRSPHIPHGFVLASPVWMYVSHVWMFFYIKKEDKSGNARAIKVLLRISAIF